MKILLPFFIFLFTLSKSYGQGYTPFPEANAVWIDHNHACFDNLWLYELDARIYFDGDTIIAGLTYHVLAAQQLRSSGSCGYNNGPYEEYVDQRDPIALLNLGYLRQDTSLHQVYYLQNDTSAEIVLYDFNLNVGDTAYRFFHYTSNLFNYDSARVLSIDTFFSDKSYRRFNFEISFTSAEGRGHEYPSWIEGIGSTWGLLYPLYFGWDQQELKCFSRTDSTIYPYFGAQSCPFLSTIHEVRTETLTLKLSPNPTTNTCTINFSDKPGLYTATITDITGREIMPLFQNQHISTFTFNTTTLPPGLYFIKLNDNTGHFAVSKLIKE